MRYELGSEYFIRPLRPDDLVGRYFDWFEDELVCKYNSHGGLPKGPAEREEFVRSLSSNSSVIWGIFHRAEGHVGNVSLQSISWLDRVAEFAIIIGEVAHWSKGLGGMVGAAVVRHGFEVLNLEKIFLATASSNKGMIRLAESLGFAHEGTLRKHLFLDGQRVDAVMYGLLRVD